MENLPNWKGLFDWSMKYQDGTRPSRMNPQEFTPDRRKWLEEALQHYMQDFGQRMKEIKRLLDATGGEEQTDWQKETLLDELTEIVESVDFARDLYKVGGLPTLKTHMASPHNGVRSRAAEVAATALSNNPSVQQWFMEGGILPPLMALLDDDDETVQTKGLLALSALLRHQPPALDAFRGAGGLQKLAVRRPKRAQRKALQLLQLLLSERPSDTSALINAGGLGTLLAALADPDDTDFRQAALGVLTRLAENPAMWQQLKATPELHQQLAQLDSRHRGLSREDQEAEAEEGDMIKELQQLLAAGPAHPRQQQAAPAAAVPQQQPSVAQGASMGKPAAPLGLPPYHYPW